jgi:putative two-component system response regulator
MKRLQDLGDINILSVEDDSFNQEMATAIFEPEENITVFQAEDGKEALALLDEKPIDLILLDIMMPNMNGIEMLKHLKENSIYNAIPVVMVTSENSEKKTAFLLGADDFISKPYNPEELKLRVFNHIKVKKFCDILHDIKEGSSGGKAPLNDQLCSLKEAVELVDSSQKHLLQKIGTLAHQNGHKDLKASERIGEYAKLLADLYGLDKKKIDNLYYAMAIYDIGLLRIDKNALQNDESQEFKKHPELGLETLEGIENTVLINLTKDVMLYHHENWDGTGFPNGLSSDEIPVTARIAAVVDYFDELTSHRIYAKEKINSTDALEIMHRERGNRFDPEILDIFMRNFDKFKAIKDKFTD